VFYINDDAACPSPLSPLPPLTTSTAAPVSKLRPREREARPRQPRPVLVPRGRSPLLRSIPSATTTTGDRRPFRLSPNRSTASAAVSTRRRNHGQRSLGTQTFEHEDLPSPTLRRPNTAKPRDHPSRPTSAPPARIIPLTGRMMVTTLRTTAAGMTLRRSEHRERLIDSTRAHGLLRETVRHVWASSTTKQRASLWERYRAWLTREQLQVGPSTAALFANASALTVQGRLSNAKAMSGIFHHLEWPHQELISLQVALRKQGGGVPRNQALPLPREVMVEYTRREWLTGDRRVAATTLLAWKTASRWDEAHRIPRHRRPPQGTTVGGAGFISVSDEEIVVDWWTLPKGSAEDPFRPGRFAIIRGPLTSVLAKMLRQLGDFTELCPLNSGAIDARWARDPLMRPYTAHSIKRGVTTHLDQKFKAGEMTQVPPFAREHLEKHSAGPADPANKMGHLYGGDDVALAAKFATQHVTPFT
jgi:hypothetical protein